MRHLKTKHRLILLFTIYFFIFILLLGSIFIGVFRTMLVYQTRKDISFEFSEIIAEHIGIDEKGIFFKKDKKGDTLRSHLFNDGVNALFVDGNNTVIRAYGVFELKSDDTQGIFIKINQAKAKNVVLQEDINYSREKYVILISPIKFQNKVVGVMVLSKSYSLVHIVTNMSLVIFGIVGLLGLLGSFGLGFVITNSAFSPLYEIIRKINKTSLDQLDERVSFVGHPDDELIQLGDKFNTMLERLSQMSARQKEFIANASHELKTPLTRAITSLEVVSKENITEGELRPVKEDLFEMANLIDELLLLGKLKEGFAPQGESSLKKTLVFIQKKYEKEINEKNISFSLELKEDLVLPIPFDYAKIIFGNIISNAIKYSPTGGMIAIKKEKTGVTITDNGLGMDENEMEHIFDRFYRGKGAKTSTKGYGLGLSLVKQICDMYRLEIRVRSEKNKGTSFYLSPKEA